jgi:hypothetical protein
MKLPNQLQKNRKIKSKKWFKNGSDSIHSKNPGTATFPVDFGLKVNIKWL